MSQETQFKLQKLPFHQNGTSVEERQNTCEKDTKMVAQNAAASAQQKPPNKQQLELELEKVIGTTSRGTSSIQVNPVNGDIATLAGAFLSIYSYRESRQTKFLHSRQSRMLQSLTFSKDGTYLAAGESAFRHPGVTIWQITYKQVEMRVALPRSSSALENQAKQEAQYKLVTYMKPVSYEEVAYVKGHKFGIEALLFSPKNDFLITLGDLNDRGLFVWDWKNEQIISQNKLSKPALAIAISEKQDFFVTAGYQHLKYWYLDEETGAPIVKMGAGNKPMLESTQVDLTKTKKQVFVGVAVSATGLVYVIGADGHVYLFQKSGKLYRWMNIKVQRAFGCTLEDEKLLCACSDGTIRIFNAENLQHMMTMSKPPPLGSRNVKAGQGKIKLDTNKNQMMWADVVSISIDQVNKRAVVLYSDKMMLVWDLSRVQEKKDFILKSFYSHSGPIHDLKQVPNSSKIGLNSPQNNIRKKIQNEQNLTRFATCSSDRTIRFWHFIDPDLPVQEKQEIANNLFQNAYSKDLSQVIFVENSQDLQGSPQQSDPDLQGQFEHFKAEKQDRQDDGTLIEDDQTQVGRQLSEMVDSIRCIGLSQDGRYLASGDEVGNVRIHQFSSNTVDKAQTKFHPSHNLEVISLAFSPPLKRTKRDSELQLQNEEDESSDESDRYLLVSGGRDQSVLVYDSQNDFDPIDQIDQAHQSTITSLYFNSSQHEMSSRKQQTDENMPVQLLSAGADKNLISKQLNFDMLYENGNQFLDEQLFEDMHKQQSKDKILSMDIARQAQFAVTGSEKSLTLWKVPEFKKVWEKRVFSKDNQEKKMIKNHAQLRVLIDDLASVVVSSSTTKRVTIYETASQTVLARASPGQITTSMTFTNNFKHLITSSESGLIFFWKLPQFLTKSLVTVRQSALKRQEDLRRIPSIIQEVPEEYLNSAQSTKVKERHSKLVIDRQSIVADLNLDRVQEELENKGEDEDQSEFNFDLPERQPQPQPSTTSPHDQSFKRKRNDELNDVLSQIKAATNFVAEIAAQESPRPATNNRQAAESKKEKESAEDQPPKIRLGSVTVAQETEEDDLEPISNPFGRSKINQLSTNQQALEPLKNDKNFQELQQQVSNQPMKLGQENSQEQITHLESESDEEQKELLRDQSPLERGFEGEAPGNEDENPDEEVATSIRMKQVYVDKQYSKRFANYGDDSDEESEVQKRLRKDLVRRSSEMWHRQSISSNFAKRKSMAPSEIAKSSAAQRYNQQVASGNFMTGFKPQNQPKEPQKQNQNNSELPYNNIATTLGDEVTDIIDDQKDVLVQQPIIGTRDSASGLKAGNFQASLKGVTNQKNSRMISPTKPQDVLLVKDFLEEQLANNTINSQDSQTRQKSPPRAQWAKAVNSGEKEQQNELSIKPLMMTSGSNQEPVVGDDETPLDEDSQDILKTNASQKKPFIKKIDTRPSIKDDNNVLQFGAKKVEVKESESIIPKLDLKVPQATQSTLDQILKKDSQIDSDLKKVTKDIEEKTNKIEITPPQKHHSHVADGEDSIVIGDDFDPKNEESKSQQEIEKGQESQFNASLQEEIDTINASLSRINSLVSQKKTQNKNESQKGGIGIKLGDNSRSSHIVLHESIEEKLTKSLSMWNSMMQDLNETTTLDVEKLSQSFSEQSSMRSPAGSQSQSHLTNLLLSDRSRQSHVSQQSSSLSQVSIKDDARDLLDKYSQMLLEQVMVKMQNQKDKK